MQERIVNLWDQEFTSSVRCITTNGFVKKDGTCVMGRGCAREAKEKFSNLALELGQKIKTEGNCVHYFPQYKLATFPTKHVWMEDSDILLIQKSAIELVKLHTSLPLRTQIVLPRPGCGNGGLRWKDVKPIISVILSSDDFVVISNQQEFEF